MLIFDPESKIARHYIDLSHYRCLNQDKNLNRLNNTVRLSRSHRNAHNIFYIRM